MERAGMDLGEPPRDGRWRSVHRLQDHLVQHRPGQAAWVRRYFLPGHLDGSAIPTPTSPPQWLRIVASFAAQAIGWLIGFAGYWAYTVLYLPRQYSEELRQALDPEAFEKIVSLGWTKGHVTDAGAVLFYTGIFTLGAWLLVVVPIVLLVHPGHRLFGWKIYPVAGLLLAMLAFEGLVGWWTGWWKDPMWLGYSGLIGGGSGVVYRFLVAAWSSASSPSAGRG